MIESLAMLQGKYGMLQDELSSFQVVVYEGKIREKPSSKEEARQFIKDSSSIPKDGFSRLLDLIQVSHNVDENSTYYDHSQLLKRLHVVIFSPDDKVNPIEHAKERFLFKGAL
ncbi:hypothetical protein Scep_009461 [Stephania cephalantha]|uniref:Uncharacterized protein n=1 Tax=Stephania cephalantha TaxID=152367 RepID=A0AAP0EX23_9MAGN